MKTTDPRVAVRHLFDETVPRLPQLSSDEIRKHLRDWAGGDDAQLYSGPRQYAESLVTPHFQSLRLKLDFEDFVIEPEERWQCAFVKTFYSGVVNFLLVWRGRDEFAVTATGDFPVRESPPGAVSAGQEAKAPLRMINHLPGPSRFWRCPGCGAILQKKAPMESGAGAIIVGTVTCGGCQRGYSRSDVYGGSYDLPEVELNCPNCSTLLRGPKDDLLGKPCPACSRSLPFS